ncbi:MAG: fatty acid desaturase [Pseudomonadota bacterium]
MISHQALVAALGADARKALTRRSNWLGLRQLAGHWGAILLCGTLIAMKVPFWPVLLPVQGILIVFCFTALHETIHKTAFASERLNDLVAWTCGFLIALPPRWFRYFHFAHHRFTNDPTRDPELAAPKPETLSQYLVHLSGIAVWRFHLRTLIHNSAGRADDTFLPAKGRAKVTRETRLFLLLYALLTVGSLALGSALLLWVWLLPALLGQPFLRAYLLAEHGGCPQVANMLVNSRTTLTNRLVRFLAWNMPFHAEHHAYPAVPFHKLPQFHAHTRDHLGTLEPGYLAFHRKTLSALT